MYQLPLYILSPGHGRFFTTKDERGRQFIPVFTDVLVAKTYFEHFAKKQDGLLLLPLMDRKVADDVFQMLRILDAVAGSGVDTFVALNPKPPGLSVEECLCLRLPEFLRNLVSVPTEGGPGPS